MLFDFSLLPMDRTFIAEGQLWRIFTGHFYHVDTPHLLYNLGGLGMILLINSRLLFSRSALLLTLALSAWVSGWLLLNNPEIGRYGGLSGILHGLFFLAVATQRELSPSWRMALIIGLVAKVIAEQAGIYHQSETATEVAVDAHLYGLLGGVLWWSTALLSRNSGYASRSIKP